MACLLALEELGKEVVDGETGSWCSINCGQSTEKARVPAIARLGLTFGRLLRGSNDAALPLMPEATDETMQPNESKRLAVVYNLVYCTLPRHDLVHPVTPHDSIDVALQEALAHSQAVVCSLLTLSGPLRTRSLGQIWHQSQATTTCAFAETGFAVRE